MKAKLGAPEAITATAHKLARVIYRMLKYGEEYVRQGLQDYEKNYQARKLQSLRRAAAALGLELIERQPVPTTVS